MRWWVAVTEVKGEAAMLWQLLRAVGELPTWIPGYEVKGDAACSFKTQRGATSSYHHTIEHKRAKFSLILE